MKRALGGVIGLVLLAGTVMPALAQTSRGRYNQQRATRDRRYDDTRRNRDRYERRNDDESFLERHRDKVTVAAGTGVGAAIGAVTGGKKGAIIGALVGAGASALYTYGLRDRDDDNNRRNRRRR